MPLTPALAASAGVGAVALFGWWRAGRRRAAAGWTTLAVAAGVVSILPVTGLPRTGNFAKYYAIYAGHYAERGDWPRAVSYGGKALAYDAAYEPAYLILNRVYTAAGDAENARAVLARGARNAPGSVEIQLAYGVALLAAGDPAASLKPLETATKLAPERADGWLGLAEARYRLGRYDAAAAASGKLTALTPEDPAAWARLGEARFAARRLPEAAAAAARVAALDPGRGNADYIIGTWFYDDRDYPAALTYLERAVNQQPSWPPALRALALTYGRLDRKAEGRAAYDRYLKAGGRADRAAENLLTAI